MDGFEIVKNVENEDSLSCDFDGDELLEDILDILGDGVLDELLDSSGIIEELDGVLVGEFDAVVEKELVGDLDGVVDSSDGVGINDTWIIENLISISFPSNALYNSTKVLVSILLLLKTSIISITLPLSTVNTLTEVSWVRSCWSIQELRIVIDSTRYSSEYKE